MPTIILAILLPSCHSLLVPIPLPTSDERTSPTITTVPNVFRSENNNSNWLPLFCFASSARYRNPFALLYGVFAIPIQNFLDTKFALYRQPELLSSQNVSHCLYGSQSSWVRGSNFQTNAVAISRHFTANRPVHVHRDYYCMIEIAVGQH